MRFLTSMTMVDRIIGNVPFVYEGDFVQGVKQAKMLGYDGVELHIANPVDVDALSLGKTLDMHQMRLTAIGTGRAYVNEGLSITDKNAEKRKQAVARLEAFIDLGAQMNAIVIIGCMRGNISEQGDLPQAMERLAESMLYLDEKAREKDVTLVFEPINRYENNFLCTMEEISDFIRENKLTNTGVLADTFHMNIEEPEMLESIRNSASELRYVHIADSNRRYPGCGHIDFSALFHVLEEIGYEGVLSAECLPIPTKETAAREWICAVKELMEAPCSDR